MGKEKINLLGCVFDKLTVIEEAEPRRYASGQVHTMWKCRCECGEIITASTNGLRNGKTHYCRNLERHEDLSRKGKHRGSRENLVGKVFNQLTVLGETDKRIRGQIAWECECTCGNKCLVSTTDLKHGYVKSCGCLLTKRDYHIGEKYGRLTIIDKLPDKNGAYMVLCKCDCGVTKGINLGNVIHGKVVSCGCYQTETIKERTTENLAGMRFGRLVVVEQAENIKGNTAWKCVCDCGNTVNVRSRCLKAGMTKSCGCLKSELSSERFSNKLEGQKFGKLTVIERRGTVVNRDGSQYAQWYCKCECGCHKLVKGADLISGKVKSCGCMISYGEYQVRNILESLNVRYSTQYSFSDLKSSFGGLLRFDFALYNAEGEMICLIEYQGIQHYREENYFGEQQRKETDSLKKEYCHKNNIKLFEIRYDEDVEQSIKNILKNVKL